LYKIPANTLFVGKNLVFVPECHSTNLLAHDLSHMQNAPEGTIVITDNQTAGRGQRGNSWEAEPGKNLTLSVILKPSFLLTKDQFFLNIFTSLAIHDLLLDKTNAIVRIKWPNDLMVGSKKICGILIENQIRASQVSNSIVGIGLNVNQANFTADTATSLIHFRGMSVLQHLLDELCERLEARYLQLRSGNYVSLKADYISRLYWKGEQREFAAADSVFTGIIDGIDESGKLSVGTNTGIRTFDIKELSYLR
jgi:BirA family transcriptional regulator, biotin operon repressor / biotin---[acetyl-CoA-carboxylase] ligase